MESQPDQDRWITESAQETRDLAGELLPRLRDKEVISLIGPLGSGKTTFVKGLADACAGDGDSVRSPTFSLLQQYKETEPTIVHADLYRTEGAEAQRTIGLTEYFGTGLLVVEWADRWELGWPNGTVSIVFSHEDKNKREIKYYDCSPEQLEESFETAQ